MTNNIIYHSHPVTREDRSRQKGQSPVVIWFTGLSASGKSTIAGALEQILTGQNYHTYLLDGDNVRLGLCSDLGFSNAARQENIRRVGETANLMMDAGLIALTAFISPFRADRRLARSTVADGQFIEVFVDTPLALCEERDPKGLYQKARQGKIPQFTGIDSPYETPENPEIHLDGSKLSITESVNTILAYLNERGILISGYEKLDDTATRTV